MIERLNLEQNEIEKLQHIFYAQAFQIMKATKESLHKFAAEPGNTDSLQTIKRYIHTLKGDASIIGLESIGMLCQKIEEVLALFDVGAANISQESLTFFTKCVESVEVTLKAIQAGSDSGHVQETIDTIENFIALHKKNA
jgi:chemotaxis protein histidine kinase CheA